jgi:hypothetical protein
MLALLHRACEEPSAKRPRVDAALAIAMALSAVGLASCAQSIGSPARHAAFELSRLPVNAECLPPVGNLHQVTFNIESGQPVTVTLDGQVVLPTAWDIGFAPDPFGALMILDATGVVVVANGQVLPIPENGSPRLAGHLVCIGDTVWIFNTG